MNTSLPVTENLDKFLKLTQELEKCDDKIKEEHQAVLLLNSLPAQFDTFKDVIQYSTEEVTVKRITEAVTQKNLALKVFKMKGEAKSEALMGRLKPKPKPKHDKHLEKKKNPQTESSNKQPLDKKNVKCFY